jgi:hypothetical protein
MPRTVKIIIANQNWPRFRRLVTCSSQRCSSAGPGALFQRGALFDHLVIRDEHGVRLDGDSGEAGVTEEAGELAPDPAVLMPVHVVGDQSAEQPPVRRIDDDGFPVGRTDHDGRTPPRDPYQLGQGLRRLGQVLEHAIGAAAVEDPIGELQPVRITLSELDRRTCHIGLAASLREQRFAAVDPDHAPAGRHHRGQRPHVSAGAAADLEEGGAAPWRQEGEALGLVRVDGLLRGRPIEIRRNRPRVRHPIEIGPSRVLVVTVHG